MTATPIAYAMAAERKFANMSGPEIVTFAIRAGRWTQADLARESGLNPATIGAFKKGRKPTAAHRAAICWAIAKRTT